MIHLMNIPYQIIDWDQIPKIMHAGEPGHALWQTMLLPGLRIRLVEYASGYCADHWCQSGHLVHCLEGELTTEMESGETYLLKQGMSYIVTDGFSSHRARTKQAVKLLIIDGNFLKSDI